MTTQKISLNDRFDLAKSPVLLNGTQALVRVMMMQAARDKAAGLNTAGLVTGYRCCGYADDARRKVAHRERRDVSGGTE